MLPGDVHRKKVEFFFFIRTKNKWKLGKSCNIMQKKGDEIKSNLQKVNVKRGKTKTKKKLIILKAFSQFLNKRVVPKTHCTISINKG